MKYWSRLVAFLSRREDAASLAMVRIVAGSTIAFHLALMWWSGVAMTTWVDMAYGGQRPSFAEPWLRHFGGCTPLNVKLLLILGIASATLMTFGVATRATVFLTWLAFHTLTDMNDLAGGSSDDLLLNAMWILIFSGCGRAFSVDQWWRRRRDPAASCEAPAWPRYVLILQLVLVYTTTGLQKISIGWVPWGSLDALWFILQQPTWHRFGMRWIAPFWRVTQLATLITWLFENGGPLLLLALWYRATKDRPGRLRRFFNRIDFRLCYLALGCALHLGIWALMEVGPFFNAVLCCYVCFIFPDEWRRVASWLRGKIARDPNPVPASATP